MAKILGGTVEVPHADCALPWQTLLSFPGLAASLKSSALIKDWSVVKAMMDLMDQNYRPEGTADVREALQAQDMDKVLKALDDLSGRVMPTLMTDVIACECKHPKWPLEGDRRIGGERRGG